MQNLGNISIDNKHHKKDKPEDSLTLIRTPHTKHNSNRGTKNFFRNNTFLFLSVLVLSGIGWVYYIPPSGPFAVVPFIILLTGICSLIASFFGKKIHLFTTLFVFLFLLMSYFIGFDVINALVLLSFIIGLSTLFKIKN